MCSNRNSKARIVDAPANESASSDQVGLMARKLKRKLDACLAKGFTVGESFDFLLNETVEDIKGAKRGSGPSSSSANRANRGTRAGGPEQFEFKF